MFSIFQLFKHPLGPVFIEESPNKAETKKSVAPKISIIIIYQSFYLTIFIADFSKPHFPCVAFDSFFTCWTRKLSFHVTFEFLVLWIIVIKLELFFTK